MGLMSSHQPLKDEDEKEAEIFASGEVVDRPSLALKREGTGAKNVEAATQQGIRELCLANVWS